MVVLALAVLSVGDNSRTAICLIAKPELYCVSFRSDAYLCSGSILACYSSCAYIYGL